MRSYCVARRIENVLDAEIIAFEELSITLAPTVCVPLSIFVREMLVPVPFESSFPSIVMRILCPDLSEGLTRTDMVTFPLLLLTDEPFSGFETTIFS